MRVLVALSGGVDSSVAALLLCSEGHEVEAAFMKNWDEALFPGYYGKGAGCSQKEDQEDAHRVANALGIPFHIMNFTREYVDRVMAPFFEGYRKGVTPNPDVWCNAFIKFGVFASEARRRGFDAIATGHHARIADRGGKKVLMKGADPSKDQSYFLWALSHEQLQYSLFPIGEMTKEEVRAKARAAEIPTADKPDSQGICFVGEGDVGELLRSEIGTLPGPIVTVEGERIGEHEGLHFYTEGQRRGIHIGGGIPYYVVAKDTQRNALVVAKGAHHPSLYSHELVAREVVMRDEPDSFPFACAAKIRYRQEDQSCEIQRREDGRMQTIFRDSQRAVTPGQSVVWYTGDVCMGGGIIEERK